MKVGKVIGGLVTVAVIAVGGFLLWKSGTLEKIVPEVETDCKTLLDKVKDKDTSKYVKAEVEYDSTSKGKGTYVFERNDEGEFVCSDINAPYVGVNTTLAESLKYYNDNMSDADIAKILKFKTGLNTYTVETAIKDSAEIGGTKITVDGKSTEKYNSDGMIIYSYTKSSTSTKESTDKVATTTTTTTEYSIKWTTK